MSESPAPASMRLALFPLHEPLFPGGRLALQIFEVRYLDLVNRCVREGEPFGVVRLTAGHEVQRPTPDASGNPVFAAESFETIGTLAHLDSVEQVQSGLLRIACTGGERFRIERSERQGTGLWMAQVQMLAEDAPVPVPAEYAPLVRALRAGARRGGDPGDAARPRAELEVPDHRFEDAGWVANRCAERLPIDAAVRQQLMALDNPLVRLELVGDLLEQISGARRAPPG